MWQSCFFHRVLLLGINLALLINFFVLIFFCIDYKRSQAQSSPCRIQEPVLDISGSHAKLLFSFESLERLQLTLRN